MRAVAKPTRRVLISRHTCELTQVGGRKGQKGEEGGLVSSPTRYGYSLGPPLGCGVQSISGSQERAANGADFFAQEPFA